MKTRADMTISEAASILGFSGTASLNEIRKRYHDLVKEWHPDVSARSHEESHETVVRLNEAYDILVDYCMNYQISFDDETMAKRNTSRSMQYWHEHFGDDPIWG